MICIELINCSNNKELLNALIKINYVFINENEVCVRASCFEDEKSSFNAILDVLRDFNCDYIIKDLKDD